MPFLWNPNENEFVLDPKNNKFIPKFCRREVDYVHCLWQYVEENRGTYLDYLNGCHPRIRRTIEVEIEGKWPFVD